MLFKAAQLMCFLTGADNFCDSRRLTGHLLGRDTAPDENFSTLGVETLSFFKAMG